jgi:hypothetical protein
LIPARKWAAARLAPKKYGDRVEHDHKGGLNFQPAVLVQIDPYLTLIPLAPRQKGQEGFGRVRQKLAGERHKLHRRGGES